MNNHYAFYLRLRGMFAKILNPTSKNLIGYMSLTYSITGLLVILGLFGEHVLAAEVAVVQGAALATFYVLSGDARHLILSGKSSAINVISFRIAWVLPLALLSYFMSTTAGQVDHVIATCLVLRRSAEWLAEPHVTEIERKNEKWFGFYTQPLLLLTLVSQILITDEFWVIWLWAISPILFSFKFMMQANTKSVFDFTWQNITSTAVIGFTGYIQRVLIVTFVGKEFSGMLFPGFAVGSFLGTMAANVVGPTLINKGFFYSKPLVPFFGILLLAGFLILLSSDTIPYQTMGLSIIGGVAMIAAQQSRLLLLKNDHTLELDLLFQLALLFSIPTIYFIGGPKGMMVFYLTGSLLAWFFYKGNKIVNNINKKWQLRLAVFIVLGLIFPVFFQLSGQIYNNHLIAMVDSGGSLQTVPLPISLLFCYLGVFVFIGGYNKSEPAVLTISAMFLLLVLSTIITNQGTNKFILLIQYIIPTVALLLGIALIGSDRKLIAKVFLFFLIVFVPAQLLMTWMQGRLALTHYMYLFSVYSHYQYVPLVLSGLFAWALVELRYSHTKWLYFITPWMGFYVAAGNSVLALFGLAFFACAYACQTFLLSKRKVDFLIPLILLSAIVVYFYINSQLAYDIDKRVNSKLCQSGELAVGLNGPCLPGLYEGKFFDVSGNFIYFSDSQGLAEQKNDLPVNASERKAISLFYINEIAGNPLTLIYGHQSPPPRNVVSSAHNYYLDLIYNFGVLACLPLLLLVLYTTYGVYKQKNDDHTLIWLLAIVMYFVIVDNFFKVTLRQPYPGIIAFFLWGVLLGVLNFKTREDDANRVKYFGANN